ncbi:MAG: tetratricopeptide repeat protein [Desulfobacterales bacterium]|nr:tetratricopeptide repeat protein [Deltaproteobacteria bacterium]NNL41984.1 tetratricopeptide repeat protein [Desulfobacterales bacterium]
MIPDNDFKTATMARVYFNQGHYEKAKEIYKHLLKYEPDSRDLATALAEVESKLQQKTQGNGEKLADMFSTWIDFIISYKTMRYLKKIKKPKG